MATLIGLDFGTTSFKAIAYDERGEILASSRATPPDEAIMVAGVRVAIWRPERVWEAACALLRQVVDGLPDRHADGLAISELGLVGLPLDREYRPLFPAVTWIDSAAGTAEALAGRGLDDETVFGIAGNGLNPFYPPAWINWLRGRAPAYGEGMAYWLNIGTYIALKLSGIPAVDYSMASQLLTLNQHTCRYDTRLLDAFDLPADLFAEPRQAGTPLGPIRSEAAAETGLPAGTPIILGGADYICGGYGGGFLDPGDVAILTGTWELVLQCADQPLLTPALGRGGAICDPHVVPDRWSLRIEAFAGDVTEWCRRELALRLVERQEDGDAIWAAIAAAAGSRPPGCGGVVFIPHLNGSCGPIIDAAARGAFAGLTSLTTRSDMIRAVFEGLSFQSRHALESLSTGLNRQAERIVCLGGATRNQLWLQIRADILGRDVEVTTTPDVTPRGAAMLAGVGAGVFGDHREAARGFARPTRLVEHNPALTELYSRLYTNVYVPLQHALSPFSNELTHLNGASTCS